MAEESKTPEAPKIPVYDLELEEFPFKVRKGKGKDAVLRDMVLVAFGGPERDAWMNYLAQRTERDNKGVRTGVIADFDGLQAEFLSRCVFDTNGNLVPKGEIMSWPGKMQMDLFQRGQKMSGLADTAEQDAKNV